MTYVTVRQFVLAAITVAVAPAVLAHATSSDEAGPRIAGCRIGWNNEYKVGYWTPMWVDVVGDRPANLRVEVTVPDSDGVNTTVAATPTASGATNELDGPLSVVLYVKVGRVGSSIDVTLVVDGKAVDRLTLAPGSAAGERSIHPGLPATAELIAALGPVDLAEAFPDRRADNGDLAFRAVELQHVADLPTEWFGYEGIDTLVLSTGDLALSQELASDKPRRAALERWIELGGRLVVFCGRHAPELLADEGPLAALVPGTFVDTVRLTETSPLDHFSQSEVPLSRGGMRTEVVVAHLRDVTGPIEAFAGSKPTDLPLVVRAARGMGELTFVGVDLDVPPLADWPGRSVFLRAIMRPYTSANELANVPQTLVTLGYSDLAGALRQQLGRSFASVTPVTFSIVAILVIAYLILLGPGDYFLVGRFGRPQWLAWLTFPVLVIATSGGAYWLAQSQRGEVSVNQLELVDVDLTTGQARGTYWATLYSPEARRYDLAVDVRLPNGQPPTEHDVLLSWLGLPGTGLGGMQATSVNLGIVSRGYRFTPGLAALDGVPLLTSATKSLLARWTATTAPFVSAQLEEDADGLVAGTLTNLTGTTLTDARLLYGGWAYRLGALPSGQRVEVSQNADVIQVKTLITRAARGDLAASVGDPFLASRASVDELLNVMMFYRAAGGYGFANIANQYQSYCDFSRLLDLGRAILVAEGRGPGSTLMDQTTGTPLPGSNDQTKVVYRFILSVENSY